MNRPATEAAWFLVSVRSPEEARLALAGGADIIDVKEPSGGVLGAAPLSATRAIVAAVDGARPVSATVGDCALEQAAGRIMATARTGVDYVKIGLFGDAAAATLNAFERHARSGVRLIAVLFADRAPNWETVADLARAGFAGVMLDTVEKRQGGLRRYLAAEALAAFLAQVRGHGMLAGLAGSLQEADAPALLPLRPDVLGFRGALCEGKRSAALSLARVQAMRSLIPLANGARPVNTRLRDLSMAEES